MLIFAKFNLNFPAVLEKKLKMWKVYNTKDKDDLVIQEEWKTLYFCNTVYCTFYITIAKDVNWVNQIPFVKYTKRKHKTMQYLKA